MQNVANVNSNIASQTEPINAQIIKAQEQIRQSEQNLSAQHTVSVFAFRANCIITFCVKRLFCNVSILNIHFFHWYFSGHTNKNTKVLIQQQQKQIDEAIEKAQNENVIKQAEEQTIRLADFDAILQPIIDSCTKDSISAGKNGEQNTKDSFHVVIVKCHNWLYREPRAQI